MRAGDIIGRLDKGYVAQTQFRKMLQDKLSAIRRQRPPKPATPPPLVPGSRPLP